jgi:hypothetical protein
MILRYIDGSALPPLLTLEVIDENNKKTSVIKVE